MDLVFLYSIARLSYDRILGSLEFLYVNHAISNIDTIIVLLTSNIFLAFSVFSSNRFDFLIIMFNRSEIQH